MKQALQLILVLGLWFGDATAAEYGNDLTYTNQQVARVPWSVHIVRLARTNSTFEIQTTHAEGRAVGLTTLSEQVRGFDPRPGAVAAGLNGDFYQRDRTYAGDPRGLQIVQGELVSAPDGGAAFWVGPDDGLHLDEVQCRFEVVWPDGGRSSFGLNGERQADRPELYTPALGASTRTASGPELVLERMGAGPWLPLRVSARHVARIREVRASGDSPLTPETMVLSLGPTVAASPLLKPGALLQILTTTWPAMAGAKAAIGGGPVLVREGRRQRIAPPPVESYEFTSMLERHPRSALGWTRSDFLLVQVDGRQRDFSVGMTLDELARFMAGLGCVEAMNLDGGGSATLWYDGQVRNRPCDGKERPLANAVVVARRGAAGEAASGADQKLPD